MPKNNKTDNKRKVNITDTILRDAHQSLLATRMRTEDMLLIADKLDKVGYWSLEAWGGATFDTCLRFLKEDPWERLRELKKALPNTKLQMLLRGQNIVGYRNYSDDVLKKFVERAAKNGIEVFRIFDAVNDIRNMETSIQAVKSMGAIAEAAICYTISPVHNNALFVETALQLEEMGADVICIKDMAGLLAPYSAYELVKSLKEKISLPIHIHSHHSTGMSFMSYLKAIEAGADIVDTAISSMALGTSQPPTESLVAALSGTPLDTGLDLKALSDIAEDVRKIRKKYKKFESEYAVINTKILVSQIPGGMISNLAAQLKEQNALNRMEDVLEEIPRVREDLGYPPLVTPTSQIVGSQATLNVLTGERYKIITSEIKNYLKGLYGKPPGEINKKVIKQALKDEQPITCRPADLLEPELEKASRELGGKAKNIEDVLSYVLFPNVALEFFEERELGTLTPESLEEETPENGENQPIAYTLAPSEFNITVHGESYHVKVTGAGHKVDGKRPFYLQVDGKLEETMVESLTEIIPTSAGQFEAGPSKASVKPKAQKEGDVTTPMPGRVTSIRVKKGAAVSAGDTVLTVEAMKMENEVHTPIDGIVKKIHVKVGDNVNPDETLIEVEKE
ncbi:MAG: sodium-extruding oxaloacetate decarboxylase subunit alpha [Thermodesulfobacteriota bacterium]